MYHILGKKLLFIQTLWGTNSVFGKLFIQYIYHGTQRFIWF